MIFIWYGISYFGLPGAGMAFFGLYLFHFLLTYFFAKHLIDFKWSRSNARLIAVLAAVIPTVFLAQTALPTMFSAGLNWAATFAMGAYSIKTLHELVGSEKIRAFARKIVHINLFFKA